MRWSSFSRTQPHQQHNTLSYHWFHAIRLTFKAPVTRQEMEHGEGLQANKHEHKEFIFHFFHQKSFMNLLLDKYMYSVYLPDLNRM